MLLKTHRWFLQAPGIVDFLDSLGELMNLESCGSPFKNYLLWFGNVFGARLVVFG